MYQKEHNIGRKEEHVYVHPTIEVGKLQLNRQTNKQIIMKLSIQRLSISPNIECDKYLSLNGCLIFN